MLPALPENLGEAKPNVEAEPEPGHMPGPHVVPEAAEPPAKKIKSAYFDDWLMDIVCVEETKQNIENVVEQKVTRYLGSNVKAGDESLTVLQWWKANECFYPRISRQEISGLSSLICFIRAGFQSGWGVCQQKAC